MIARLIDWSGRNRWMVLVISLILAVTGAWAAVTSPLDAVPDLSDPQVIVFSEWMGRSPELVEAQVTYPLVTGAPSSDPQGMGRALLAVFLDGATSRPASDPMR